MVKIKKAFLIGILLLICVVPLAFAESQLSIDEVKFTVNGKKDTGTIDVKPEDSLKVKITVLNTYTGGNVSDIEDITGTVTFKDIDDGDDLEEEIDFDDLGPGDDDSVTVTFEIPLEVDADTYNLIIDIEGDDAVNSSLKHTATEEYLIRVKKEKHDVQIRSISLVKSELSCVRTTQLSLSAINLGKEAEDASLIQITNAELGINLQDTYDFSDDPFDAESKYSKTFNIKVPEDAAEDTYALTAQITFDDGSKTVSDTVDLVVSECKKEEEVVVETPKVTQPTTTEPPIILTPPTTETGAEEGLLSNKMIIGIIVLEVIIIIVGIILAATWIKKK